MESAAGWTEIPGKNKNSDYATRGLGERASLTQARFDLEVDGGIIQNNCSNVKPRGVAQQHGQTGSGKQ